MEMSSFRRPGSSARAVSEATRNPSPFVGAGGGP
jgi:hypothetical protein